ncbi:cell division protein FtsQ/DivIB [Streptococcus gallinaceus]|uniref:Cell division protein DivIB n=1 Tax=Streptococcus gallinaceus TaxID=165758 RepID=A0ABV2JHN7_9STRE
MTERDLKDQETVQEPVEELEETASNSVEESDTELAEKEVDTADNSEFFQQWKARHQAYLSSKMQDDEQEETQEEKESHPSLQHLKKVEEKEEKQETQAPRVKRKPIPSAIIWKSVPVFLVSFFLVISSIYFISPYSKQKNFTVTGNNRLSADKVLAYSQISSRDYALTTLLHKDDYAKNIEKTSAWVKSAKISYQFPQNFTIQVEEYTEIGFIKKGDKYHSVLSNGAISETAIQSDQLPKQYTSINLKDADLVKELALQLVKVKSDIVKNIETVDLTPTRATSDLLTLTMYDGNKVLVPLSEVERKLPYYEKITPQLTAASVVDMEVGIFSYAQ